MKTMVYVSLTLLASAACGRQESSESVRSAPEVQTTVSQEDADYGSFYAATEADAPVCDPAKNKNQLIYVSSLDSFRVCDVGGYKTVVIKGKDGSNGTNGKDLSQPVQQNEWVDPLTAKRWMFGHIGNQVTTNGQCTGTYKTPATSDLQDACYHGIFRVYEQKMGALIYTHAWGATSTELVLSTTCLLSTQSVGASSTIICVAK